MVRKERLELSRREALEPKSSVSTNSTTPAKKWGGRWDLNPRQPESQSGALPTELRPPLRCCKSIHENCTMMLVKFIVHCQVLPDSHGAPGRIRTCDPRLRRPLLYPAELRALDESLHCKKWSVRQDLNLRPLVPKTSALPSCATHRLCNDIEAFCLTAFTGCEYY
jgi:hypothetical protein